MNKQSITYKKLQRLLTCLQNEINILQIDDLKELSDNDIFNMFQNIIEKIDQIKKGEEVYTIPKKEKEDQPTHAEIMQHIEDEGFGGNAIRLDGNPTFETYEDAKKELIYQKQEVNNNER